MSLKRIKKLATQAYCYLTCKSEFAGFVSACKIMGIDVFRHVGGSGVTVRSPKFWVERFYAQGEIRWIISNR